MLRPRSLQRTYDEFFSGDDAFEPAPKEPEIAPDATTDVIDAAKKAYEAELKAYQHKLEVARETCEWSGILKPGGNPTKFVMRLLPGDQFRYIADLAVSGRIGRSLMNSLLVRAALTSVVNFEGLDPALALARDEAHPILGKICPVDIANKLDLASTDIINELAAVVIARSSGALSPK